MTIVGTAAEALRLAKSAQFDAYVLDQRLPDATSTVLCRQLLARTPGTPVLFYSAAAYQVDRQRAIEAGVRAYLTKPNFEEFAESISRLIKEAQRGKHLLTSCALEQSRSQPAHH